MPHGEEARAVVWRIGEALLAVPLDVAMEIAAVGADGQARARTGRLEVRTPPGVTAPPYCPHAVVVRTTGSPMALAAEAVDGVLAYTERHAVPAPAWLGGLPTDHIAGLIRLNDQRVAALLAVEALTGA